MRLKEKSNTDVQNKRINIYIIQTLTRIDKLWIDNIDKLWTDNIDKLWIDNNIKLTKFILLKTTLDI